MKVYRISKCNYISDLTGTGSALYGGRWNSKGIYVLYAAGTASLALLETIVHMAKVPVEAYCLIELEIPDKISEILETQLPESWNHYPASSSLKSIGDEFIKEERTLALKIPSALIPEESIYLLNPNHPDFKKVRITKKKNISIDARLKAGLIS